MKKLSTILILTFLMVSGFAQKQVLQLQLVKGETYKQNMDFPMQMKYDVGGESVGMDMTMKMYLSFKVLSVDDNFYFLEAKYDYMGVSIDAMGNKMEFSSDNKAETNPTFKFFNEITKNSFNIKMEKSGKLIEITGYSELLEKAIKKFPEFSEQEKENLKTQFNQSFNEETIKQNFENIVSYFPTYPIGLGDQWNYEYSSNVGAIITVNAVYTLKEITTDYILLDVTAIISSPKSNDFIESNGMMMKFNLKGTMTSTIKLDPKTCWTINSTGKMIITGTAEMEASEQLPEGMMMDMSIDCDMIVTDGNHDK